MSYKSKAETTLADAIPHNPVRKHYPCFADGCPMPGTIFTGSGDGTCAWHYNVNPSDIPRITRVLLDWQCLAYEVNEARRALTGELAADPKALDDAFRTAWERLKPLVSGWEDQLAPGLIRDSHFSESYGDWAKRLERFLGGQIVGTLRKKLGAAA